MYAGFAIGLVLPFSFAWLLGLDGGYNFLLSVILLGMISYGFELFSLLTGFGRYDLMDAVATVAGGLPALAIAAAALRFV